MPRRSRFLVGFLFPLAAFLLFSVPSCAAPREVEGEVTRVADGDTLTLVTRDGTKLKVRLYGIDAPEIRHEEMAGQPHGEEAKAALEAMTLGKRVTVRIVEVDTHRRLVGVVYRSGTDVNREMVRSGNAWAYRRFLSAPYASGYIEAEKDARSGGLGLWKQVNPDPPWKFKDRSRHGAEKPPSAKHVILFIGDGMGFEQVKAAGMVATGKGGTLSFEAFPHRGSVRTRNAEGGVTDSASAATAMATGVKVGNDVISTALPGNGAPLATVLERFQAEGKSTGLVTTTFVTHATPAAFGAHEPSRYNYARIAADYLRDARPNVLFGGALYITRQAAESAGYAVVSDRAGLLALDTEKGSMVSGQFGNDHMPFEADGRGKLPSLPEMTRVALRILDNDPDGLFLMVEGGRIDHACHANDIRRSAGETIEFSRAVAEAVEWGRGRTDTLIIVTSDHDTGGLRVLASKGRGALPAVTWRTTEHTADEVPIYGWGKNAEPISGSLENTDVFRIMLQSFPQSSRADRHRSVSPAVPRSEGERR